MEKFKAFFTKPLTYLTVGVWMVFALLQLSQTTKRSLTVTKLFTDKSEAQKRHLLFGELSSTVALICESHEDARILLLDCPFEKTFRLDYFAYPRRLSFQPSGDEPLNTNPYQEFDLIIRYNSSGKPTLTRIER